MTASGISRVLLVAILFGLCSCGGGSSDTSTTVTSVVVIPTISSITVNGRQAFTANALNSAGNTVPNTTVTWTSSATDVATIDNLGIATGKAGGTTQITASVPANSVTSAPVSLVVLPQIASVSVSPATATIKVGAQQPFVATAKDVQGNTVSNAVFSWAISFSGIATIDNNGVATAVSPGTVFVTASVGGVTSPVATLNVTN